MAQLPQHLIAAVRDGRAPDPKALQEFVCGMADGRTSEGQMAAFAMAIRCRGLAPADTARLTLALRDSGERLSRSALGIDLPLLDKHSTGGVGDSVSLALAPMLASCGAAVPMLSGRGLGHTGGTLDKLAALPGYQVDADLAALRRALQAAGCAIISAGRNLAPADRRLYAVRDVTATVDAMPLIVASILSKKLAIELDALVLDVKCGNGALFPDLAQARQLAQALVEVANNAGLRCSALVTDMSEPLLPAVGNATEMRAAIGFLRGDLAAPRLREACLLLGAEVLQRAGLAANAFVARQRLSLALDSGEAMLRFARMARALGTETDLEHARAELPVAPLQLVVPADRGGFVQSIDARALGELVVQLGGGRRQPDAPIDFAVGLSEVVAVGRELCAGDPLLRLHLRSEAERERAIACVRRAFVIGEPLPAVPLLQASVRP